MPVRLKELVSVAAVTALLLLPAACSSYGPRTLNRDQLDYSRSIGDAWKDQVLANLVKIRYVDMPVFVDVGQIVSGYSVETAVNGTLGFNNSLFGGDTQVLGAEGRFTDRPTITYIPKTGEGYLRSLLEPVNPSALLSLVLAGYSPELLFTWAVESINGVKNYSTRESDVRTADPGFTKFVQLLTELQQDGAVGFELENNPDTKHDIIFFYDVRKLDESIREKVLRTGESIGLSHETRTFRVLYSPFAMDDDVLAIQTRSILQILIAMAKFVDIPPDKASRAVSGFTLPPGTARPFHVHTSREKPADAFATFRYHGDWYWIEHEDIASKRVFTLMLFLTTLTNRASEENAPVLTIPTN